MKKLLFLFALALSCFVSNAQILAGRGTYGTLQPYVQQLPMIYSNTLVLKTADTLKGVDTVYLYFTAGNAYRSQFTIQTVQKADSLTGTAILQAWAGSNTGWVTRTGYWESVTGITSLCTTCVGASKTFTVATGTNKATWDVGLSTFQNFRIRIVGTRSTDTTAITGSSYISY